MLEGENIVGCIVTNYSTPIEEATTPVLLTVVTFDVDSYQKVTMGIEGLLRSISPLLIPENELANKSSFSSSNNINNKRSKPKIIQHNIRQFSNKSLAIDASSWLYKASYSCAERLVEAIERNEIDATAETRLCNYMMKRCEELLMHASIKRIYLVFDGKRSPLKEHTNKEREKRRRKNLNEARRLKSIGSHELAQDKYKACVKVMPWMAKSVEIAVNKKWGGNGRGQFQFAAPRVSCVFSPYEADAQLVKLCIDGHSNAIVTEVSTVAIDTKYSISPISMYSYAHAMYTNSNLCRTPMC